MAPSAIPRRFALVAVALLALAPIWLGPALLPLLRAVGEAGHTCACGMARGKCGCPVCVRLERERRHAHGDTPVVKATCDDDGVTLPAAPLPPCAPQCDLTKVIALGGAPTSPQAIGPPKLRCPDGPQAPPPRA